MLSSVRRAESTALRPALGVGGLEKSLHHTVVVVAPLEKERVNEIDLVTTVRSVHVDEGKPGGSRLVILLI